MNGGGDTLFVGEGADTVEGDTDDLRDIKTMDFNREDKLILKSETRSNDQKCYRFHPKISSCNLEPTLTFASENSLHLSGAGERFVITTNSDFVVIGDESSALILAGINR